MGEYINCPGSFPAMARTLDDIRAGRLMKWEIPGMNAREGGFILGQQIFCVQEGFASSAFLCAVEKLFAESFEQDVAKKVSEFNPGGLTWDFIVAVYRGDDINDVVAACALVYGQSGGGEQYLYLFNVCTDRRMMRQGLARKMMGAVNHLCCAALRDRECNFWRQILSYSDKLWSLLTVDISKQLVVPPDKLIAFYASCGFSVSGAESVSINPLECCSGRFIWAMENDPLLRCEMRQEILLNSGDRVCPEWGAPLTALSVFERLLDRHMTFLMDAPQSHLPQNVVVQRVRPIPSRE
jgi:hypothetical protein